MLHDFLTSNRNELIDRCREKVAKRSPHAPVADGHGVPLFLLQLVDTLYREKSTTKGTHPDPEPAPASTPIGRAAALHGAELLRSGYSVDEVVHNYGDVCQAVTELAAEVEAPVTVDEFRTLNRCLDDAIADAVTAFARGHDDAIFDQAESVRRRVFLVNEQRRLITTAIQTFTAIKSGNAGLAGANGTVLVKALVELRDLIDDPAPEIRRAPEADLHVPDRIARSPIARRRAPDQTSTGNYE